MSYDKPELNKVGNAAAIVLGDRNGHGDSSDPGLPTNEPGFMALGLDE
jgi:hypothetical protein